MYVANHYVRINRTVLTAGEILPDGLPEEKIAWLLKVGAIREIPGSVVLETAATPPAPDSAKEDEEKLPDGNPIEETVADEEPEEIDEEAEPEEIDVMAGIVPQKEQEDAEAAPKSGKRGGRRSK